MGAGAVAMLRLPLTAVVLAVAADRQKRRRGRAADHRRRRRRLSRPPSPSAKPSAASRADADGSLAEAIIHAWPTACSAPPTPSGGRSNQMKVENTDLGKQLEASAARGAALAAGAGAGLDQAPPLRPGGALRPARGPGSGPGRRRAARRSRRSTRCWSTPDSVAPALQRHRRRPALARRRRTARAGQHARDERGAAGALYPDGPKALPPELRAEARPAGAAR